jgi:hypothetical protein
MSLFRPNLDARGRIIRGVGSLALGMGAVLAWPHSHAAGIALGVSSAFVAFEAARGWCIARACGVKTKF